MMTLCILTLQLTLTCQGPPWIGPPLLAWARAQFITLVAFRRGGTRSPFSISSVPNFRSATMKRRWSLTVIHRTEQTQNRHRHRHRHSTEQTKTKNRTEQNRHRTGPGSPPRRFVRCVHAHMPAIHDCMAALRDQSDHPQSVQMEDFQNMLAVFHLLPHV